MTRIISLFVMMLLIGGMAYGKKTENVIPEYQIEGAGPGRGEESIVKVWILAKDKNKVTDAMLATAAVHGVLFRGYSDNKSQGFGGASEHRAIAGSPAAYTEYIDFFEPFFTNGEQMNYVRFVDDQRTTTKVGKEYKVAAVVRVNTGQLKKDLQSKKVNVVKGLNSGW